MPRRNKENGVKASLSVVQQLYLLCVETFSVPCRDYTPDAIHKLHSFLDRIRPADLGIKEPLQLQESEKTKPLGVRAKVDVSTRNGIRAKRTNKHGGFAPPITYVHVYECDRFSIGIFCLPPSGVLPLHNHPGMTVLSKLLYGSLHLRSYDIVTDYPVDIPKSSCPANSELAKTKVDRIYTAPCEPTILCPKRGGTIHSLTAVTACAILDVLAPPYSDKDGRHCTYYRLHPCHRISADNGPAEPNDRQECSRSPESYDRSSEQDDRSPESDQCQMYVWLEEGEVPEDFVIRGDLYRGPKIDSG